MIDPSQIPSRRVFLRVATYFEGSLAVLAFVIGWMVNANPAADLRFTLDAVVWGLAGTVPLYLLFQLAYRLPLGSLRQIKRFLLDRMGPLLDSCRWTELLYLGLLAGFTEEILFRGLLQPWFESRWGWGAGLLLSNLLFGAAHFITPLYALLAALTGVYLGYALDFGGERNLLNPIVIHAAYDFLAFMAVVRAYRLENSRFF